MYVHAHKKELESNSLVYMCLHVYMYTFISHTASILDDAECENCGQLCIYCKCTVHILYCYTCTFTNSRLVTVECFVEYEIIMSSATLTMCVHIHVHCTPASGTAMYDTQLTYACAYNNNNKQAFLLWVYDNYHYTCTYIHVCSLLCERSKAVSVPAFGIEGHCCV